MFMNFQLSFEKLGVAPENRQTFFRFDDTNPEAESDEYIQSLKRDVAWMGWKPNPTTFSSDYFQELHELAVKLIKKDKAYVCYQTKADIEATQSPWRNRPIVESLKDFEDMRKGKFGASDCTLRMKIDMTSPNPNMWDPVAYRIKYVPHPHAGSDWCIYPTYDYTHCIIDSLEHIDYSICTLEFETRRESYYWLLEALDLYRPKVYEMSRLNLTNTVLSKRRLLKLVNGGFMRSWSDPRMPTIQGLRPAQARTVLHETSPRIMGVVEPIKVVTHLDVPNFPFDVTRGTHPVPLPTPNADGNVELYIDNGDFRMVDDPDFFGLAPNKMVGLRYYARIFCESVDCNADGKPMLLHCASDIVPVELRVYNNLFIVEEPTDDWEAELNPLSEEVKKCYVDSSVFLWNPTPETAFQLERLGFVNIDNVDSPVPKDFVARERPDTTPGSTPRQLVMNMTVSLNSSKPRSENSTSSAPNRSRKAEEVALAAEKERLRKIPLVDLFKHAPYEGQFKEYDDEGIPTVSASGEPVTKSMSKKLKKEWEKHKKFLAK
eukprot:GSChrysophyteH1.ASY1.ANO1.1808.1 assembled CDS